MWHLNKSVWTQATGFTVGFVISFSAPQSAGAATADFLSLSPEQLLNAEVISASKRAEPMGQTPAAVILGAATPGAWRWTGALADLAAVALPGAASDERREPGDERRG